MTDLSIIGAIKFTINIRKAKNLAAKDSNGSSDPYCEVSIGLHKFKTQTIDECLHPEWNETCCFEIDRAEFGRRKTARLELRLFDYDLLSSDDFLGMLRLEIPIKDEQDSIPYFDQKLISGISKERVQGTIDLTVSVAHIEPDCEPQIGEPTVPQIDISEILAVADVHRQSLAKRKEDTLKSRGALTKFPETPAEFQYAANYLYRCEDMRRLHEPRRTNDPNPFAWLASSAYESGNLQQAQLQVLAFVVDRCWRMAGIEGTEWLNNPKWPDTSQVFTCDRPSDSIRVRELINLREFFREIMKEREDHVCEVHLRHDVHHWMNLVGRLLGESAAHKFVMKIGEKPKQTRHTFTVRSQQDFPMFRVKGALQPENHVALRLYLKKGALPKFSRSDMDIELSRFVSPLPRQEDIELKRPFTSQAKAKMFLSGIVLPPQVEWQSIIGFMQTIAELAKPADFAESYLGLLDWSLTNKDLMQFANHPLFTDDLLSGAKVNMHHRILQQSIGKKSSALSILNTMSKHMTPPMLAIALAGFEILNDLPQPKFDKWNDRYCGDDEKQFEVKTTISESQFSEMRRNIAKSVAELPGCIETYALNFKSAICLLLWCKDTFDATIAEDIADDWGKKYMALFESGNEKGSIYREIELQAQQIMRCNPNQEIDHDGAMAASLLQGMASCLQEHIGHVDKLITVEPNNKRDQSFARQTKKMDFIGDADWVLTIQCIEIMMAYHVANQLLMSVSSYVDPQTGALPDAKLHLASISSSLDCLKGVFLNLPNLEEFDIMSRFNGKLKRSKQRRDDALNVMKQLVDKILFKTIDTGVQDLFSETFFKAAKECAKNETANDGAGARAVNADRFQFFTKNALDLASNINTGFEKALEIVMFEQKAIATAADCSYDAILEFCETIKSFNVHKVASISPPKSGEEVQNIAQAIFCDSVCACLSNVEFLRSFISDLVERHVEFDDLDAELIDHSRRDAMQKLKSIRNDLIFMCIAQFERCCTAMELTSALEEDPLEGSINESVSNDSVTSCLDDVDWYINEYLAKKVEGSLHTIIQKEHQKAVVETVADALAPLDGGVNRPRFISRSKITSIGELINQRIENCGKAVQKRFRHICSVAIKLQDDEFYEDMQSQFQRSMNLAFSTGKGITLERVDELRIMELLNLDRKLPMSLNISFIPIIADGLMNISSDVDGVEAEESGKYDPEERGACMQAKALTEGGIESSRGFVESGNVVIFLTTKRVVIKNSRDSKKPIIAIPLENINSVKRDPQHAMVLSYVDSKIENNKFKVKKMDNIRLANAIPGAVADLGYHIEDYNQRKGGYVLSAKVSSVDLYRSNMNRRTRLSFELASEHETSKEVKLEEGEEATLQSVTAEDSFKVVVREQPILKMFNMQPDVVAESGSRIVRTLNLENGDEKLSLELGMQNPKGADVGTISIELKADLQKSVTSSVISLPKNRKLFNYEIQVIRGEYFQKPSFFSPSYDVKVSVSLMRTVSSFGSSASIAAGEQASVVHPQLGNKLVRCDATVHKTKYMPYDEAQWQQEYGFRSAEQHVCFRLDVKKKSILKTFRQPLGRGIATCNGDSESTAVAQKVPIFDKDHTQPMCVLTVKAWRCSID